MLQQDITTMQADQLIALETALGGLESRVQDISAHTIRLQAKNEKKVQALRDSINVFLTELISTVGSQFDKMQAQLLKSQQHQIKVCYALIYDGFTAVNI